MKCENVLIIEGSRKKTVLILLLSIALVSLGIYLIKLEQWWGWVCSIFFGLGIPLALVQLFRKSYIKLDAEGFEVNPGINPWKLSWADVDSFYVGKIHGNKMVAIKFSNSYEKMKVGRMVSSIMSSDMESAINNQYKLSPELLCEQLNAWKLKHSSNNSA